MTLMLPLLAFAFVSLLVVAAGLYLAPAPATSIEQRLVDVATARGGSDGADEETGSRRLMATLKRLGAIAPRSTSELGKLQQRLVTAGYRNREAVVVFFGIRLGLAVLAFVVFSTPLISHSNLRVALAACGFAYLLPSMVLARVAKRRQHALRMALPDALDLLVVSVEAGLGLDQALQRVADELNVAHPELSDELRLINLELRAGKARAEALHNLAARTGIDDISSLVTMLVQTDKFGTSVAQALRVHSESMRTKRRQRAEEAAAKTGAKMVFPLVLCIFPAIWVVTLGSVVIKFIQVLMPMAKQ